MESGQSDKQHFHLLVAPRQPSLACREKKKVSGFNTVCKVKDHLTSLHQVTAAEGFPLAGVPWKGPNLENKGTKL